MTNSAGYGCAWYVDAWGECEYMNTETFVAAEICCACGGGSTAATDDSDDYETPTDYYAIGVDSDYNTMLYLYLNED
jgi:hypothetical protein